MGFMGLLKLHQDLRNLRMDCSHCYTAQQLSVNIYRNLHWNDQRMKLGGSAYQQPIYDDIQNRI